MTLSRRTILAGAGLALSLPQATLARKAIARKSFTFDGVYLDAAFSHPFGDFASDASVRYTELRRAAPQGVGPRGNARNAAVERFARLINAHPNDVAVMPSTLEAENRVNAALAIGRGAGVVTDALHYDGALALYNHLNSKGVPVSVVRPRGAQIDLADIRAAIKPETKLIAVSLVSSTTGFTHDLAELCAMAHERGVLVYADAIQAAGAMAVDVKSCGVDFLGCGTYKWLMGDFGCAFLYVRPDRLEVLQRVEVGWRQLLRYESHVLPYDRPGAAIGDVELAGGAAGLFEVSTPAWGALAVVAASLDTILEVGVDAIARQRIPLLDQIRRELKPMGFDALTPEGTPGPILTLALRDVAKRIGPALRAAHVQCSLYEHRIRISPSIYNNPNDVEQLARAIRFGLRA